MLGLPVDLLGEIGYPFFQLPQSVDLVIGQVSRRLLQLLESLQLPGRNHMLHLHPVVHHPQYVCPGQDTGLETRDLSTGKMDPLLPGHDHLEGGVRHGLVDVGDEVVLRHGLALHPSPVGSLLPVGDEGGIAAPVLNGVAPILHEGVEAAHVHGQGQTLFHVPIRQLPLGPDAQLLHPPLHIGEGAFARFVDD